MIRASVITVLTIFTICLSLTNSSSAHPAWGIVVDRHGQVYFSDLKTIRKIDAEGKLSVFRPEDNRHTHDLNIDEAGNIYGIDDLYDPATRRFTTAVWKMTPRGEFSYLFAPTDNPPRGMSLWKDRNGNTYSVEQNNQLKRETLLLKRTPSGNVSVLAGGRYGYADGKGSQARFGSIVGLTFGSDGSLYLTESSNVRKVTMEGIVTTLARNIMVENGNLEEGSALFGIAIDAQGNAFIADYGNRRILKIAPNGQRFTLLRSEESWFPTGIAEKNGDLYILEESHTQASVPTGARVRKLSPDGKISVLASVGENTHSSVSTTPASPNIKQDDPGPKQFSSDWLIGICVCVLAVIIIIWQIRRKKLSQLSKSETHTKQSF
jgi:hypothetical protein